MGLLDGGLKDIFGTAFAPILLDGLLHVPVRVDATDGDISETFSGDIGQPAATACKAVAIEMTDRQRDAGGYNARDVLIIVLQKGINLDVSEKFQITAKKPGTTDDVRYALRTPITVDPAGATWTLVGSPIVAGA